MTQVIFVPSQQQREDWQHVYWIWPVAAFNPTWHEGHEWQWAWSSSGQQYGTYEDDRQNTRQWGRRGECSIFNDDSATQIFQDHNKNWQQHADATWPRQDVFSYENGESYGGQEAEPEPEFEEVRVQRERRPRNPWEKTATKKL